jgi:hypothetical protein
MGFWDVLLLVCVAAMGTLVAYVRTPRRKALVLCLPVPFTLATLALGENVNPTHALGLLVLLGFWVAVYGVRHRTGLPIVAVIALAAAGYCVSGAVLAKVVPRSETWFWLSLAVVCLVGTLLYLRIPHRDEPQHRTRLPVWVKLPILLAVVTVLVLIKSKLSGFMTVFPMVGVLTAYEARHSLWTTLRQIPVAMLSIAAMMATMHTTTPRLGVGAGVLAGWAVWSVVLVVLVRRGRWTGREDHAVRAAGTG